MVPKGTLSELAASPVVKRGLDGTWVLIGLLITVLRRDG